MIRPDFGNSYFKKGYKAFVMGGRNFVTENKKRIVVLDSSLDPYDYFSESQKDAWNRGVQFAKEERIRLRSIKDDLMGD